MIYLFVLVFTFVLVSPPALHAAELTRTGASEYTVRDFRAWSPERQYALVLGWVMAGRWLDLKCRRPLTVGETVAALRYRPGWETGRLFESLFVLDAVEGCAISPRAVPPKPFDEQPRPPSAPPAKPNWQESA